jgi:hypothetical protein
VFVDDVSVISLQGGQPPPGSFVRHVSQALRHAVAEAATRAYARSVTSSGQPWLARARIVADRDTRFAVLGDVLFTANLASFREYELLVNNGRQLRARPLAVPPVWSDPDAPRDPYRLHLVFNVRPDSLTAGAGGNIFEFPQRTAAEISDKTLKLKRLFPDEFSVTYRVHGDVTLQTLTSLIDTVTGESCELTEATRGKPSPGDCQFWRAILDFDPPIRVDPLARFGAGVDITEPPP